MKASTLLLTVMSICILLSSCQKSDLSENKNLLKNSTNAEKSNLSAKKKNISIGDYYGGGIVCLVDAAGEHGLIVSTKDLGTAPWGCIGVLVNGTDWGNGAANTDSILYYCHQEGIAAKICQDLVVKENQGIDKKGNVKETGKKYSDWFLPSVSELGLLLEMVYESNDPVLLNAFPSGSYWTSVQGPVYWKFNFFDPSYGAFYWYFYSRIDYPNTAAIFQPDHTAKTEMNFVRAIRAF